MRYEIYKITNLINKKVYIGLTTQGYLTRFENHLWEVELGCDYHLHKSIRKYGKESFTIELIENCSSVKHLKDREIYWISFYRSNLEDFGYNMTDGGDGTHGRKFSQETKDKIRNSKLATNYNDHIVIMDEKEKVIQSFHTIIGAANFLNFYHKRLYDRLSGFKRVHFLDIKMIIEVNYTHNIDFKIDYLHDSKKESLKRAVAKSAEVRKTNKSFITKQQANHPGKKKFLKVDLKGNIVTEYSSQKECIRETGYTVNRIKHAARQMYIIEDHYYIMAEKLELLKINKLGINP